MLVEEKKGKKPLSDSRVSMCFTTFFLSKRRHLRYGDPPPPPCLLFLNFLYGLKTILKWDQLTTISQYKDKKGANIYATFCLFVQWDC
jgi:hypothetical protein